MMTLAKLVAVTLQLRVGHAREKPWGLGCREAHGEARLAVRAPILMSPDINWPFWPFPRHSSWGLMSESRHCSPGFGAAFVRIPMEKPPNRHVPRQKTAATRPFLSEPRHCPENKIPPLLAVVAASPPAVVLGRRAWARSPGP